jgi:DNA-directed RNA polymerase specialized sigma24 family protein
LAESENKPLPRVPEYIGKSILLICNRLSTKANFAGYTWDLVSDAIVDCVAAVDNFKPEITANPFAYFTQIAYFAFLRRIQKEKMQSYIKNKYFLESDFIGDYMDEHKITKVVRNESSEEIIKDFEDKLQKNKEKSKISRIKKKDIDLTEQGVYNEQ